MPSGEPLQTQSGNLYVLSAEFPGDDEFNIGVILEDPATDRMYVRMRRDWDAIAPDDYYDYLAALETDFRNKGNEMGARKFLDHLASQLSNTLQITDGERVAVGNYPRTLALLYERHIHPKPLRFQTHLPLYSLRSAAGKFLENDEVECESWVEAPAHLRLSEDMFVAEIQGTSMEPLVHDGDLAVFRKIPAGSRLGKRVLVEERGGPGRNNSYTLKRYNRGKDTVDRKIVLEPLNPEHEKIPLESEDEDRYRIIAEFMGTA